MSYLNSSLVIIDEPYPRVNFNEPYLLIFDQALYLHHKDWIDLWPYKMGVTAGEELKNIQNLSAILEAIQNNKPPSLFSFVAFGGGSVTDAVGFIASIWKRGAAPLIHIPSTWLSAIDSAHGGKTAFNSFGIKNQLGTFFWAKEIWISKKILNSNPPPFAQWAYFEALKIGIIDSEYLFNLINAPLLDSTANNALDSTVSFSDNEPLRLGILQNQADDEVKKNHIRYENRIWDHLKTLINAKLKIVNQDPFENSGRRRVLNLGHTLGHIIEAQLGLNHGLAIAYGITFSYLWSNKKGYLDRSFLINHIPGPDELKFVLKKLGPLNRHLAEDKKKLGQQALDFIFIKKAGEVFNASVTFEEFIEFAEAVKIESNSKGLY